MNLDPVAEPESPRNFIGRNISRLRYQRARTQDQLVAKLQILGCDISRDILASVETLRSIATDKQVWFLAVVFDVEPQDLFNPLPKSRPRAKVVGIATPAAKRPRSDGLRHRANP
jgi:transcriptional regulator with XRE-family HTH domain